MTSSVEKFVASAKDCIEIHFTMEPLVEQLLNIMDDR